MLTFSEASALVTQRLPQLLIARPHAYPPVLEAFSYSVMAGGKRLRPIACLLANQLLSGDQAECLDLACSLELLHTSTLIHDDLPSMDNDDLRRGQPTSHVVFGEAFAILAGDGLLNLTYEIMLENAKRHPTNLSAHLRAMTHVAHAAGASGLVSGQWQDLQNIGQSQLSLSDLELINAQKTGVLITASLLAGLELCTPTSQQRVALQTYGDKLGFAFQLVDDLLDVEGSTACLGKTIGKDNQRQKTTFVSLLGIDQTKKLATSLTQEAIECLAIFDSRQELEKLARKLLLRLN